MDKFFTLLISLLEKITLTRVLQVGLLIIFLLIGYIGYSYTPLMAESFSEKSHTKSLKILTKDDEIEVLSFMKKYKNYVVFLNILKFDFPRNTRISVYRAFNNDEIKQIVDSKLNEGNINFPIFFENDKTNNDQVINLIKGEMICSPFKDGGISRIWPDLNTKLLISCLMPIPPAFGVGVSGYIVVHLSSDMRPFEYEAMKLDLRLLAKYIHTNIK